MSDNDENQQQTKQNSPWSARISDSTKKLIQESTRTTGGSVAKKVQLRVEYLPWIVIGGSRDGFQVEAYRAND